LVPVGFLPLTSGWSREPGFPGKRENKKESRQNYPGGGSEKKGASTPGAVLPG
jgi:hypothetical protein